MANSSHHTKQHFISDKISNISMMTEERKFGWWWSPFRSAQVSMLTTYIIPSLLFLCQGYTPLGHLLVLLVFIISLVAIFGLMWVIVSKYGALCSFYFFFFFSHSEDICVLQPAGDWILVCWILYGNPLFTYC